MIARRKKKSKRSNQANRGGGGLFLDRHLLLLAFVVAIGISQSGVCLGSDGAIVSLTSSLSSEAKQVQVLEAGKPIERELRGGEVHSYEVAVKAGEYLRLVVEQRGIDVVVTLFGADGKQLMEVHTPNKTQGEESISAIAEESERYRLEVRSLDKNAQVGRYKARIAEQRKASEQDKSRILAEKAYSEALQLQKEDSAESLQKAVDKQMEALQHWREANDQRGEAKTLSKIGQIYYGLGEAEKALEIWVQELGLRQALGERKEEGNTLNSIGVVYSELGEKQKALDYYSQSLQISRALGDREGEAYTLNNIGLAYSDLGENQKALDYYNQSLPLTRALGDRKGEAYTLSNIGAVYSELGEQQKALDYFSQSLPLKRTVEDHYGEAGTLHNIGVVYSELGEYQKALDYYNQAVALIRAVGDRSTEAYTLTNIGAVYSDLGEQQKALDYYDQAIPLRRAVGDRRGEAITLAAIARVHRDLGNLSEALSHIETALSITESLRANITSQELRASYFASVHDYYELYIDLLMQSHKQNPSAHLDAKSLQANERARARSLLELLAEARADIHQGIDPELVSRERSLRQRLNDKAQILFRLKNSTNTEKEATALEKEIDSLSTQLQQVEAEIRQKSPRYAALTQPSPLSLKDIQQQVLDPDTLLLEYSLGKERSYLFVVSSEALTSYELSKAEKIETSARRVYDLLTTRNRSVLGETIRQRETRLAQAATEYKQAAAALSHMLLAPVATQLGKKRLLIVADGSLQYVPFAALPLPTVAKKKKTQSQPPLMTEHEIVSLPSASTLALLRQETKGRRPAPQSVAVLADPVFSTNDGRVSSSRIKSESQ